MRRAFLQLVLVALLLVGQQGAISHAVWHLHDFFPAHEDQDGHPGDAREGDAGSSQTALCDLHLAFGTLLLLGGAAQPAVVAADLAGITVASHFTWRVAQPRVAFHSRAPPVLL